ncbi:MAG: hypothetical protein Q4G09_07905 [Clostridia bacterium]|nr:hypothetical protein [Clostridia bacterium]
MKTIGFEVNYEELEMGINQSLDKWIGILNSFCRISNKNFERISSFERTSNFEEIRQLEGKKDFIVKIEETVKIRKDLDEKICDIIDTITSYSIINGINLKEYLKEYHSEKTMVLNVIGPERIPIRKPSSNLTLQRTEQTEQTEEKDIEKE